MTARDGVAPTAPTERYVGVEQADAPGVADPRATEQLLRRLTRKIERTQYTFADDIGSVNPRIPAGYTYFAQFVAHDLTISSGIDEGLCPHLPAANLRARPLHLDTLYGHGPSVEPACYELVTAKPVAQRVGWPRTRFRLDGMADDNGTAPEDSCRSPRRDVGRMIERRGGRTVGIALVADLRNDDNAIISQLTATLQLAHNTAMDRLERGREPDTPEASHLNFTVTRAALTYVYRQIVRHDLLPRLLDPAIRAHYEETAPEERYFDALDPLKPVGPDFADAAYRVGHAMVRERYAFNVPPGEEPVEHGLIDVLRRTSDRNPRKTPHNREWIVAWSNFFDFGDRPPRPSARLCPRYQTPLQDDMLFPPMDRDRPAGLAYRDLVRTATSGPRKIDALAALIAARRPELAARSPWITDRRLRRDAVRTWLRANQGVDLCGLDEEVVGNPPPMLYYLIEAAAAGNGFHVGPLGSAVLAETFYRALDADRLVFGGRIVPRETAKVVFGPAVPQTMPDLIRWIDQTMSAEDKQLDGSPVPFV